MRVLAIVVLVVLAPLGAAPAATDATGDLPVESSVPQATPALPPLGELPVRAAPAWVPEAPAATPAVVARADWQEFLRYRAWLPWAVPAVLAVTALALAAHLSVFGVHRVAPTGRLVRRYARTEVLLHAMLALSFLVAWAGATWLELGRYLSARDDGAPVPLGAVANWAHIAGGLAMLAVLVVLGVRWRAAMRFAPYDRQWLAALGGYFSRTPRLLAAGRFNAGQKLWLRVATVVMALLAVSGGVLYVPGVLGPRAGVVTYVVHSVGGILMVAAVVVHVYLAAVVHRRAMRAMITGEIDEACARADHPLDRAA
jgi:formate dehydrogenase subunit gamma